MTGLGPEFPITGYDDLTAAEVVRELDGMSAADLRKVREYERANANRKSVLARGRAQARLTASATLDGWPRLPLPRAPPAAPSSS